MERFFHSPSNVPLLTSPSRPSVPVINLFLVTIYSCERITTFSSHVSIFVGKDDKDACLSFGKFGSKLGLDESRLHETVELERNDGTRIQPQRPCVLGKIPENVRRVKETNLYNSRPIYRNA